MTVLSWGTILFGIALLIHVIVWKIRLPKRHTKVLLQILFVTLGIGVLILWWIPSVSLFCLPLPKGCWEFLHIALFFISFTLAYMITYSAVEVDSPSLVMIINIAKSGANGLTQEDFDKTMIDDVLVKPRVKDLVRDKLIYVNKDKYRLTPKGILMTKIFIFYRKLMNINRKGG